MNRETKNLLAEVLGEGAPADSREAVLGGTLRAARRRRQRRQILQAIPAVVVLAMLAIFLNRTSGPRNAAPPTAASEPPYRLVRTQPLAASEWMTSQVDVFPELNTSPGAIEIVQTSLTGDGFKIIGDDELLGIVKERPALLVRMDAHSEQLIFLHPDDANGFPVN